MLWLEQAFFLLRLCWNTTAGNQHLMTGNNLDTTFTVLLFWAFPFKASGMTYLLTHLNQTKWSLMLLVTFGFVKKHLPFLPRESIPYCVPKHLHWKTVWLMYSQKCQCTYEKSLIFWMWRLFPRRNLPQLHKHLNKLDGGETAQGSIKTILFLLSSYWHRHSTVKVCSCEYFLLVSNVQVNWFQCHNLL